MSKYTPEALRSMAREVIAACAGGDHRGLQLVLALSHRTGLTPNQCLAKINEYAK